MRGTTLLQSTFIGRALTRRIVSVLAVVCLATVVAVPVQAAATNPGSGYHAIWSVTKPNGAPRTNGKIAVGDDLRLSYAATDGTLVSDCRITLYSVGGEKMLTPAKLVAGGCALTIRLPDFPDPLIRTAYAPDSAKLHLCVVAWLEFADGEERAMIEADRAQPGGRNCIGASPTYSDLLDFPIQAGGTRRAFASDPAVVSWDPADWGSGMAPLRFGKTWHYELPAWVESCVAAVRGDWTFLRIERQAVCHPWDVRLPGVLPATMPWPASDERVDWLVKLDTEYLANGSIDAWSQTITAMRAPLEPSDTVFESSLPAIFPVDIATTRFVTAGARWQPDFQFSGGSVPGCTLTMLFRQPSGSYIDVPYEALTTSDGLCSFDVAPLSDGEWHQFSVTAGPSGGISYMGTIQGIEAPEAPTIESPTSSGVDTTEISVVPGDGMGMGMELEVMRAPDAAGSSVSAAGSSRDVIVGSRPSVLCRGTVLSPTLDSGGAMPRLDRTCALLPGRYIASARMIDAAGVVTIATRTFSVLKDPQARPSIVARTPAAGAVGVARDARPTVTFDRPVGGTSATTIRLRDVDTGLYVAATVSYSGSTQRATLRPAALLQADHTYRLYLSAGIKSASGRPILATNWTFKVSSDARRPSFSPTPGPSATDVSRGADVKLRFSEAVRGVSATTIRLQDPTSGLYVDATVAYDDAGRRATLHPTSTLRALHRYVVVLAAGVLDRAGNPLIGSGWSFTTGS